MESRTPRGNASGAPPEVLEKIKIGIAGWSYEDWKETVYPRGLKPGERLSYLAGYFDCIEINSTFYAIPTPRLSARWAAVASERPGFVFTCKLIRTLTHEKGDRGSQANAFKEGVKPLLEAGKLGAVLVQFPWYFRFTPENFDRVRAIAELLRDLPLVFEVRHRSFLNPEFFAFLSSAGAGLAGIDLPPSRSSLPPAAFPFGRVGYFRFHGRNREAWFDPKAGRDRKYDYLYSREELLPWVEKIKETARKTEKVFVITNNHYRGQAPANAVDLARLLGRRSEVPEPLLRSFPHLNQ